MRRIISGMVVIICLSLCACSSNNAINKQIAELEGDLDKLDDMEEETEWYLEYGDEDRKDMYESKLRAIELNREYKEREIEQLKEKLK